MRDVWGLGIFLIIFFNSHLALGALVCPVGSTRIEGHLGFDLEERCVRQQADGTAIQHGPFIWWFDRDRGLKRLEGAYSEDKETGVWTRYELSKGSPGKAKAVVKVSETEYRDGKIVKT